ncbi:DHHA1 domain-containing protein [Halocalculus aciditolerans]|uniref:Recombinase RecJ n=1 Tax=Halocalculus aciditolerans TaxID=1383812 RepID=A0A830FHD7_9EURY|nr:DHH family phosphoesterase [Halocalculus aciditolerans]GGL47412.1 recombinase RecJ [Halocalculus aciditolerans]
MSGPVPELEERAERCADALRDAESVLVASHIDADGLTSAGIAARMLERAEIPFESVFEKQLDDDAIAGIAASAYDTVLFTDFGSGQLEAITEHEERGEFTPIIADHHQPAEAETAYHLNPLLEGVDGGSELSGAGATYVLARAFESEAGANKDLAALAIVGAVGDMQTTDGELTGANVAIAEEGVEAGVLDTTRDLALYGTQTRPLPKLLEYASEVYVPGITNDSSGAMRFLDALDVETRTDGDWRTWADLSHEERQAVLSALIKRAVRNGVASEKLDALVATTYTLAEEEPGTEVRDASEFSTLLNATARYERADVGLAVCLGDREEAYDAAKELLAQHRQNLSSGVRWVEEHGVTAEEHVQWFDSGDEIRETIVGIVAGMALSADGVSREKVILGFANKSAEESKVSARGSHALVRRGLDLSEVMGEASRSVGGDGGGHTVAAGATIPRAEREAFIAAVDRLVGEQLD